VLPAFSRKFATLSNAQVTAKIATLGDTLATRGRVCCLRYVAYGRCVKVNQAQGRGFEPCPTEEMGTQQEGWGASGATGYRVEPRS
jgi:hypothetical protein